jgi:hypothetical protein
MTSIVLNNVATRVHDIWDEVGSRIIPGQQKRVRQARQRWLVVTVEGDATEIAERAELTSPLAELGDSIEVQVRPAPGRCGTEIAARPAPGDSSPAAERQLREQLRAALRKSKQLLEVGEVLVAEPRPAGHRPATLAGRLVDRVERRADEAGVL